ncbi:hypothetical protein ACS9BE_24210 [Salmonella enterica]
MKEYAKFLEDNMSRNSSDLQTITTKFDTPSVSMAEAIAERFGETRIAVLRNVIEQGLKDLYSSFDENTRKELAEVADAKTTKYMLSKGASITSFGGCGKFENEWSNWRQMNFDHSLYKLADNIKASNPDMDDYEAIQIAHAEIKKWSEEC